MDKGKGKSKAVEESNKSNGQPTDSTSQANGTNMASKVLASATGLARDVLGSANGGLTSSLAASTSSNGKVVPFAASSGLQKSSESSQNIQKGIPSVIDSSHQQETFRTIENDVATAEEYERFQQTSNPFVEEAANYRQQPTQWASEFKLNTDHVQEYSQDDGLEVNLLLSDPYFQAMTDETEPEPDQTSADAADLFGEDFSAEEQEASKALKADLPPAPMYQPIAADNPRNLVANLEAMLDHNDTMVNINSIHHNHHVPIHFHSQEQQNQWYSQWSGVLNQYTDEVWGDMLPIVREEQKHAEAIKVGKENLDSRSVQRLNMILGHVEQYRHGSSLERHDSTQGNATSAQEEK